MCGIAGIITLNGKKVDGKDLRAFTDSMAHRGPDGSGYALYENDTVGLGHRRLSILDLTDKGRQPLSYADGRYHITYNGEVFNFGEVRKDLTAKGYTFFSDTDTEVILAAYVHYGKSCLNHFNGMWAFAIWDSGEKELFLSRDRFGIKPLYYLHIPGQVFAFASETRAFKHLEGHARRFDDDLLDVTMADPYALEGLGYTPFRDIHQLLPAHYLILKTGKQVSQKRWWHIQDHISQTIPAGIAKQAEGFYNLFEDSCRLRLISDVPVGTALSGGLDSSSVYSVVHKLLMSRHLDRVNPDSQRAFTAVFPGLPEDEKAYAEKSASFTGGKITSIDTNYANLGSQIERDTELADFIGSSPVTSLAAVYAGMRRSGVVVSLDGHGVDEMLFGYRDMVYSLYNASLWEGTPGLAADYAEVLKGMYHEKNKADVEKRFSQEVARQKSIGKSVVSRIRRKLRGSVSAGEYKPVNLSPLSDHPYDFSRHTLGDRMLYYEFFQHTLPALLRNFDRAGMMNSIEIRMPFMDWRLVSYVFSLPISSKIGGGFTKRVLREAMKGRINEEIRTRTFKVGISSPIEHWFNGPAKDWLLDSVQDQDLKKEVERAYHTGSLGKPLARKAWQHVNVRLIS